MRNNGLHVTDRLSDYIDGELDMREEAQVEQHLAECVQCREVVTELRAVVARAASLPDSAPAQDLWTGIAPRLRAFRSPARRRFSFTLPQLAAAGIALMVLSGGMVWVANSSQRAALPSLDAGEVRPPEVAPASFADPQFDGAVEDLERMLDENRARLDPETV